jgi:hypothetical protein
LLHEPGLIYIPASCSRTPLSHRATPNMRMAWILASPCCRGPTLPSRAWTGPGPPVNEC